MLLLHNTIKSPAYKGTSGYLGELAVDDGKVRPWFFLLLYLITMQMMSFCIGFSLNCTGYARHILEDICNHSLLSCGLTHQLLEYQQDVPFGMLCHQRIKQMLVHASGFHAVAC